LLAELTRRVGKAKPFARYHEPFVGGGALFFALARSGAIAAGASLSDKNSSLIDAYRGVRNQVASVIDLLRKHKEEHSKEHYYDVRARVPALLANGRADHLSQWSV
jgi:DNA adenine methylase